MKSLLTLAAALLLSAGLARAQDSQDIPFLLTYPNLDEPNGEVVLENEHVLVQ